MGPSTPRLAGLSLRLAAQALRAGPLARLLSRRVIEDELRSIDFAAEGEPAPFYVPPRWVGR